MRARCQPLRHTARRAGEEGGVLRLRAQERRGERIQDGVFEMMVC